MSLHDAYARITPWELAFVSDKGARKFVSSVQEESEVRGADPKMLESFLTMASVDQFILGLGGAESEEGASMRFGGLAFHLYHFTTESCPLYLLTADAARYLVEGRPTGSPTLPGASGYLQLPQHFFWTGVASSGASQESIDGIFWTATSGGLLHTLLVTGIRPDRPGLGVIPLPPAPLNDAPIWLDLEARGTEDDFSASLPGGELDGLYGVSTAGEVFKLLARIFAYISSDQGRLEAKAPHEGEQTPEPSCLPYTRIRLGV